jgi:hypothetical protein
MTATKIDGTAIAKSIRERLGGYIKEKQATNPRYRPSLKIVQGASSITYAAIERATGSTSTDSIQSATAPTPALMCA